MGPNSPPGALELDAVRKHVHLHLAAPRLGRQVAVSQGVHQRLAQHRFRILPQVFAKQPLDDAPPLHVALDGPQRLHDHHRHGPLHFHVVQEPLALGARRPGLGRGIAKEGDAQVGKSLLRILREAGPPLERNHGLSVRGGNEHLQGPQHLLVRPASVRAALPVAQAAQQPSHQFGIQVFERGSLQRLHVVARLAARLEQRLHLVRRELAITVADADEGAVRQPRTLVVAGLCAGGELRDLGRYDGGAVDVEHLQQGAQRRLHLRGDRAQVGLYLRRIGDARGREPRLLVYTRKEYAATGRVREGRGRFPDALGHAIARALRFYAGLLRPLALKLFQRLPQLSQRLPQLSQRHPGPRGASL